MKEQLLHITTITTATNQQDISRYHSVKDTTKTAKSKDTGTQTTTMVVSILSFLLSIVALAMSLPYAVKNKSTSYSRGSGSVI
jgi:cell division protein FtsX